MIILFGYSIILEANGIQEEFGMALLLPQDQVAVMEEVGDQAPSIHCMLAMMSQLEVI